MGFIDRFFCYTLLRYKYFSWGPKYYINLVIYTRFTKPDLIQFLWSPNISLVENHCFRVFHSFPRVSRIIHCWFSPKNSELLSDRPTSSLTPQTQTCERRLGPSLPLHKQLRHWFQDKLDCFTYTTHNVSHLKTVKLFCHCCIIVVFFRTERCWRSSEWIIRSKKEEMNQKCLA